MWLYRIDHQKSNKKKLPQRFQCQAPVPMITIPTTSPSRKKTTKTTKTIGHGYLETDIINTPKCHPNTPDLLLCQSTQNLQKMNRQSHCQIPHPLHEHLLPCPALDQMCLDRRPYLQHRQQQHQLPSLSPTFSSFYRILDCRLEHSPLRSRISPPIKLQPRRQPRKSPHPDPPTQRNQHNPQPTTMEISRREMHGSALLQGRKLHR